MGTQIKGKQLYLLVIALIIGSSSFLRAADKTDHKRKLVWSDEFNYSGHPDSTKWIFETGFLRNVEDQYYTDRLKNVRVEDGKLILEADKEAVKNTAFVSKEVKDWRKNREYSKYTSGSISTRGKGEWTYGRIEVRAKLPKGVGLWPAVWMLGKNIPEVGWPKCGEIDIMEHVGFNADTIFGTIHTGAYNHIKGTQKGKKLLINNPYNEFHTYVVEWAPERIDFYLDKDRYYSFANEHKTTEEWPFDQPFYLKLNIAVGGMLGGQKGIDDSVFPEKMVIDYVRIYQ